MKTLCIDVGGTGIKAMVADESAKPLTERGRIETPQNATPETVLAVMQDLARAQGEFDRVSIGFPGVVKEGVTKSAPNLDSGWAGFELAATVEKLLGKPVRLANDAVVQGLAVVEGRGVEMAITLGTGLGCGLYLDGRAIHVEIAHHPFRKGMTYEQRVGEPARKAAGQKKWHKRVLEIIQQLEATFNYRHLFVGGGNAKRLVKESLPSNVTIVDNVAGMLGGVKLWL